MAETLDILIHGGIVITMRGEGVGIIEDGEVGIKGNRIIAVGKKGELRGEYRSHREIDAAGKAVMPGLIDAHIHSSIALIRGVSQDLKNWMQHGMWPFSNVVRYDKDAAQRGSMLNILEGLKAGTTTFCDFDNPMNVLVENHVKMGVRARVAQTVNEMPRVANTKVGELYKFDPSEGESRFKENIELVEKWHGHEDGRITCMFGPQGADMCSLELLKEIQNAAEKYDVGIHMHVAQGDREINQMIQRYGKRTIPFLEEQGF